MWLNERLSRPDEAELPFFATVTAREGNAVETSSHTRLANAPCVLPPGLSALPEPGDEVLMLPTADGYACLGVPAADADGGYTLSHPGGATIRLRADGSIELNGLLITREGALVSPGARA